MHPDDAPKPLQTRVRLEGMHGLGDAFHERSAVQGLLERGCDVEVGTSWPSVFHDMPVRCVRSNSTIPYCAQNEANEADRFVERSFGVQVLPVTYLGHEIAGGNTFTGSIAKRIGVEPVFKRFVVPEEWGEKVRLDIERPVMIVRPLVQRTIWAASPKRNPLPEVYEAVFNAIREHFFVISVADLRFGIENVVAKTPADVELHEGQLSFRQLAWLMSKSALTMSSPGMGVVMGQHIGVPTIGVFGGHESAAAYGDIPGPFLAVQPENPCNCFNTMHNCDKTTDIEAAVAAAKEFAHAALSKNHA